LKLALLGMGRMGREIDRLATAAGHEVVARIDIVTNPNPAPLPDQLQGAEVAIDFTVPGAVLENIKEVAAAGVPMVVGTTGWYDAMDEARSFRNTTRRCSSIITPPRRTRPAARPSPWPSGFSIP
jgi:4-hydroxy-tetrahydrodipicolinate reductase